MLEQVAILLFVLHHNIALATPTQQVAAWQAASAQEQAADRREAEFILSNGTTH